MRGVCGLLGMMVGILITNAFWVTPINERDPLLMLAFVVMAFLLMAVVKDFGW